MEIVRKYKITWRSWYFCCPCNSRSTHQGTNLKQFSQGWFKFSYSSSVRTTFERHHCNAGILSTLEFAICFLLSIIILSASLFIFCCELMSQICNSQSFLSGIAFFFFFFFPFL